MEMWSGRVACRADSADLSAGRHLLADLDVDSREVGVHRRDALSVGDDDELAPAAGHDARPDDLAGSRCRDRRPLSRAEVDTGMETEASRPER